ncbi:ComF family protein [Acaryochloris sp. IP29b_bin.137]|uniref:ComF family protein n=1 Tax=Acaryochloris sp. IP29b_bin.137 TaxID=2969217 RepID=UPI00260221AA|nr:ComF family protein [Acaryochloris sp. IP29b_bin.137]
MFLETLWQMILRPRCSMCERFAAGAFCLDCHHQLESCRLSTPIIWVDHKPLLAWGRYQGPLKQALAHLKYDRRPQVGQFLGQKLGVAWLDVKSDRRDLVVVPIPLHHQRERARGYNQSALLAESFCHVTGLALAINRLVRVRDTAAQFSLSPRERFTNVAQAFRLGAYFNSSVCRKSVVLVDDIYTTGATIHSAAETLSQAGIQIYGIAVVAKA